MKESRQRYFAVKLCNLKILRIQGKNTEIKHGSCFNVELTDIESLKTIISIHKIHQLEINNESINC